MHPENPHRRPYEFETLQAKNPDLEQFVFKNEHDSRTIDFSRPDAVFELNKALLLHHYRLEQYTLPAGFLCPAVPGRADYLCYVKTLLDDRAGRTTKNDVTRVLDVGVGANCIYPIIGAQLFGWTMVGVDIHEASVESARKIVEATTGLGERIEIRHQQNSANIFDQAIGEDEFFDVTICNPPFHASEAEASRGTKRKIAHLSDVKSGTRPAAPTLNFAGKANELWCNGGEALFIKRMIKQSASHKEQVGVFTTLVSSKANLAKLYKQLDKAGATHQTIAMNIGNKQSRMLAWWF